MSWLLPRIVGHSRAKEILLTDPAIGAEDAVRLGILSRLVADEEVQEEALRTAVRIAAGPRTAYAGIKALLRESRSSSLADQLDRETDAISNSADSPTGREGVDAFVEKRRPSFN